MFSAKHARLCSPQKGDSSDIWIPKRRGKKGLEPRVFRSLCKLPTVKRCFGGDGETRLRWATGEATTDGRKLDRTAGSEAEQQPRVCGRRGMTGKLRVEKAKDKFCELGPCGLLSRRLRPQTKLAPCEFVVNRLGGLPSDLLR